MENVEITIAVSAKGGKTTLALIVQAALARYGFETIIINNDERTAIRGGYTTEMIARRAAGLQGSISVSIVEKQTPRISVEKQTA